MPIFDVDDQKRSDRVPVFWLLPEGFFSERHQSMNLLFEFELLFVLHDS
jgi:hypothetical protein